MEVRIPSLRVIAVVLEEPRHALDRRPVLSASGDVLKVHAKRALKG